MTYVLSDIHGNMRRFHSILRQINLQPEDTLYILGDVIDRHPHGIRILKEIMAMPNTKMLLGNHEYMMLRAIGEPYDGPNDIIESDPADLLRLWYRNGGLVTHQSWKHTRLTIRAEILDYLKKLPLNIDVVVGGIPYKLVHAAALERYEDYNFGKYAQKTITNFAVWNREASLDEIIPKEYSLVFGHTPTGHFFPESPMSIWFGDHRIGIDCGSGAPDQQRLAWPTVCGRLGCLRLDDMKEFYSEEPALDLK